MIVKCKVNKMVVMRSMFSKDPYILDRLIYDETAGDVIPSSKFKRQLAIYEDYERQRNRVYIKNSEDLSVFADDINCSDEENLDSNSAFSSCDELLDKEHGISMQGKAFAKKTVTSFDISKKTQKEITKSQTTKKIKNHHKIGRAHV